MVSHVTVIEAGFVGLALLTHAGGLGVVRLLLAMLVVGSHVGALGATSAGGVGIGGFFAISGFLMARTIAANYPGVGAGRFYVNRFIRLAPPLVAVLAGTVLLLYLRDGEGFRIKSGSDGRFMPVEVPPSPFHWFTLGWRPFPLVLTPAFYTLPQAWSLVTEGCFYLVAPIAAWLLNRRASLAVLLAAAGSTALALHPAAMGDGGWMRSPVASFWIFGLGMLTFQWRRARPFRAPSAGLLRWLPTALLLVLLLLTFNHLPVPPQVVLRVTPLLMLAWLWLADAAGLPEPAWGREAGNWAYGVFLVHFLSTLSMFWIAEAVHGATGMFGLFGEPDRTELRLAIFSYLFALLFGVAVYYAIEKPLEGLRARVRRRAPSRRELAEQHPVDERLQQVGPDQTQAPLAVRQDDEAGLALRRERRL